MKTLFSLGAACVLWLITAGCAENPQKPTVQVCTPQGCYEQMRAGVEQPSDGSTANAMPVGYTPPPTQSVDFDETAGSRVNSLMRMAQTDPRAVYDVGLAYYRGDGVNRDAYKALQWMRRAGDRGEVRAQLALGKLYLTGVEEMGSDPNEAVKWLELAAGRGNYDAARLLKDARQAQQNERKWQRWVNYNRNQWRLWLNTRPYLVYAVSPYYLPADVPTVDAETMNRADKIKLPPAVYSGASQ